MPPSRRMLHLDGFFQMQPLWNHAGDSLVFHGEVDGEVGIFRIGTDGTGRGVIMAVDLDVSSGLRPGRPRVYIRDWAVVRFPLRGYDVAPDGSLVGYVSSPDAKPERFEDIQVVLGFGAELKRRIPN